MYGHKQLHYERHLCTFLEDAHVSWYGSLWETGFDGS